MKYAYARVSTRKQFRDGSGIDIQVAKLKNAGYNELVIEECSASSMERPCFDKLIQRLQYGDILIVTSFDRLARTAVEGHALIQNLTKRGVSVHILNMGLILFESMNAT